MVEASLLPWTRNGIVLKVPSNQSQYLLDDGEGFIPKEWGFELGYIQPLVANSFPLAMEAGIPGKGLCGGAG